MLQDGEAGIDCTNCGNKEIVTTEDKSELLSKALYWTELGNPICPKCGSEVTYEHYLDYTPFSEKSPFEQPIKYGYIIGLSTNCNGELLFIVKYADEEDQKFPPHYLHPTYIRSVNHDWSKEDD